IACAGSVSLHAERARLISSATWRRCAGSDLLSCVQGKQCRFAMVSVKRDVWPRSSSPMAYNRPVFQPSTRNSCLHSYRTFSGRAAIFVALFALMLGVLAVTGPQTYAVAADTKVREVLTIESGGKTHTFHVEVARTPQEKT